MFFNCHNNIKSYGQKVLGFNMRKKFTFEKNTKRRQFLAFDITDFITLRVLFEVIFSTIKWVAFSQIVINLWYKLYQEKLPKKQVIFDKKFIKKNTPEKTRNKMDLGFLMLLFLFVTLVSSKPLRTSDEMASNLEDPEDEAAYPFDLWDFENQMAYLDRMSETMETNNQPVSSLIIGN